MLKKLLIIVLLLAGVTGCNQVEEEVSEVDLAISHFLDKYADKYIKEDGDNLVLDFYVVSSIHALEQHGYDVGLEEFISKEKVYNYYQGQEFENLPSVFAAIINSRAFGIDYGKLSQIMADTTEVDVWSYTFGLIVLDIVDVNSDLRADIIEDIIVIREEDYRGPDFGGMALVATVDYDIEKQVFFDLFDDKITEDGVVSWQDADACSTASVIMGLISLGIDPRNYSEDVNLIEVLLKYENDGGFKYNLDGELDFVFSTPQAFAALVSYKIFSETNQAFRLFS